MRKVKAPKYLELDPRLVYLGDCVQIRRPEACKFHFNSWKFREGSHGLFSTADKKKIFVVPLNSFKNSVLPKSARAIKKHKKLYEKWSGFKSDYAIEFSIEDRFTRMDFRGLISVIQYVSDKWTGKRQLYQHDFEHATPFFFAGGTHPAAFGAISSSGADLVSQHGIIG